MADLFTPPPPLPRQKFDMEAYIRDRDMIILRTTVDEDTKKAIREKYNLTK